MQQVGGSVTGPVPPPGGRVRSESPVVIGHPVDSVTQARTDTGRPGGYSISSLSSLEFPSQLSSAGVLLASHGRDQASLSLAHCRAAVVAESTRSGLPGSESKPAGAPSATGGPIPGDSESVTVPVTCQHLESPPPGQDQTISYIAVYPGIYRYILV